MEGVDERFVIGCTVGRSCSNGAVGVCINKGSNISGRSVSFFASIILRCWLE